MRTNGQLTEVKYQSNCFGKNFCFLKRSNTIDYICEKYFQNLAREISPSIPCDGVSKIDDFLKFDLDRRKNMNS